MAGRSRALSTVARAIEDRYCAASLLRSLARRLEALAFQQEESAKTQAREVFGEIDGDRLIAIASRQEADPLVLADLPEVARAMDVLWSEVRPDPTFSTAAIEAVGASADVPPAAASGSIGLASLARPDDVQTKNGMSFYFELAVRPSAVARAESACRAAEAAVRRGSVAAASDYDDRRGAGDYLCRLYRAAFSAYWLRLYGEEIALPPRRTAARAGQRANDETTATAEVAKDPVEAKPAPPRSDAFVPKASSGSGVGQSGPRGQDGNPATRSEPPRRPLTPPAAGQDDEPEEEEEDLQLYGDQELFQSTTIDAFMDAVKDVASEIPPDLGALPPDDLGDDDLEPDGFQEPGDRPDPRNSLHYTPRPDMALKPPEPPPPPRPLGTGRQPLLRPGMGLIYKSSLRE